MRSASRSLADLSRLTDYGEPFDFLVQNKIVGPLDRALHACHKAVKAYKPEDKQRAKKRAALLYTERKDQVKKRGMPSPDEWDAVALTFA